MAGMTFSLAMDCKTLGVPYRVARQLDMDEMYRAAKRRKPETRKEHYYLSFSTKQMFNSLNLRIHAINKKAWLMTERLATLLATQVARVRFPVPARPTFRVEKVPLFCNPGHF
jgi:hypothetical protein